MFCPKCGEKLNDDTQKCTNCGWENTVKEATPMEVQPMSVSIGSAYNGGGVKQFILSGLSAKKKILIAAAAVIVVLVIIIASVTNSESYKINKAEKYMLKGDTSAALKKLIDIYTPQAEIMRSYVSVVDAKTSFKTFCSTKSDFGVSADDMDMKAVNDFMDAIEEFDEFNGDRIYLLPEKLQSQAKVYISFFNDFRNEGEYDEIYDFFSDLLGVYRNDFIENDGDFKLSVIKNNIDSTNEAYNKWNSGVTPMQVTDSSKHKRLRHCCCRCRFSKSDI